MKVKPGARSRPLHHVAHLDVGIRYGNWAKMMRRHIAKGYLSDEEVELAIDIHNKLEQLSELMRKSCQ